MKPADIKLLVKISALFTTGWLTFRSSGKLIDELGAKLDLTNLQNFAGLVQFSFIIER